MKLVHWSNKPIALENLKSKEQFEITSYYDKPRGIWISDEAEQENSWSAWCKAEDFNTENLRFASEIELDDGILHIRSVPELDMFTNSFGFLPLSTYRSRHYAINWLEVARCWKGILITPYLWERRSHPSSSWYYGWDCASGCIWDISAIKSLKCNAV